jgi:hypothetical protein
MGNSLCNMPVFMGLERKKGRGGVFFVRYGLGTSLADCAGATATEIDCAESGHRIIVRCRIVIICKRVGAKLIRLPRIGLAPE